MPIGPISVLLKARKLENKWMYLCSQTRLLLTNLRISYGIGDSACSEGKEMRRAWRGVGERNLKNPILFSFPWNKLLQHPLVFVKYPVQMSALPTTHGVLKRRVPQGSIS